MKKFMFIVCAGFIICTAFIKPPTDYRDVYVGRYFCSNRCQSLSSDYTDINYRNDTASIYITKNTQDSILNINIRGTVYLLKLKNGRLYPYQQGTRHQGKFFSTDSIAFTSSSGRIPNDCKYKGKKQ